MFSIDTSNLINHLDLKLYYCGTQKCNPGHSWGPAIKEHFKIHYIHRGKGFFKTANNTYSLQEGEGFLICPNVISYYEADNEYPWEYSWCAFNGLNAEEYLKRANLTPNNPIFKCEKENKIEDCFKQMLQVINDQKNSDLKLQSLLYLFLATLIDEADLYENNNENKTTKDMYIYKAIEFIQINYSHKLKVSDIANHIGLDRKYISKLFKDTTDMSLQDYIINFRFNRARELMTQNNLSISDISRSVGYADPLIFSKMFKKINGISPREYRSKL